MDNLGICPARPSDLTVSCISACNQQAWGWVHGARTKPVPSTPKIRWDVLRMCRGKSIRNVLSRYRGELSLSPLQYCSALGLWATETFRAPGNYHRCVAGEGGAVPWSTLETARRPVGARSRHHRTSRRIVVPMFCAPAGPLPSMGHCKARFGPFAHLLSLQPSSFSNKHMAHEDKGSGLPVL